MAVVAAGAACDRRKNAAATPTAATPADQNQAMQVYTVRGEVFELPDPANPRSAFRVRHEAIDNWMGSKGEIVGMSAMTMEFEPGPGVSLDGLTPGTKVAMTFEVWWEGQPPLRYPRHRITRLEKLPAETELEFRAARPPG
ncbi:MAG: copper-binding protein [Phycisphaerales bacterium]